MQLVTFTRGEVTHVGALQGDNILDITSAGGPATMLELIQANPGTRQIEHWAAEGNRLPLSSVKLRAPISNPSKIVAIGLNYMDHAREQNVAVPDEPKIFTKFPSSIIGPGDAITWDPEITSQVDYEVELGVIIGKRARNVSQDEALDYVFGYTVLNDVSARDLQFGEKQGDKQWVRGKSLDTFCPIGPAIVTTDEVGDPQNLAIRCLVNGEPLQDSSTREMIFPIAYLVSFCSRYFTLEPGDLFATGTPNGVGVYRKPPVFLKDGDTVVTEVERVGRLENPVRTER
jgi:2-keto-4-pentenoate hydratase/2-oxohepta-3-ene-1,7-dioic acid hydratase in catechol pathway